MLVQNGCYRNADAELDVNKNNANGNDGGDRDGDRDGDHNNTKISDIFREVISSEY